MDVGSGTSVDAQPRVAAAAVAPRLHAAAPIAHVDTPAVDDSALMLRYRDGDVRAFEVLYQRHKGALYRYLQRMCRNREVADDLFQEVWGKVIASRERYEARAQFTTFLFRIAHNAAVDYFRRAEHKHASAADVGDLADELPGALVERPEVQMSESQLRADFSRALQALPPEQRDAFVLYEETGLGLDEIGRITGVSMETAKSRLRYAVSKLRAALQAHRSPLHESSVPS